MTIDWNSLRDVADIVAPLATVAAVWAAFEVQKRQAKAEAELQAAHRTKIAKHSAAAVVGACDYMINLEHRLGAAPNAVNAAGELGSVTANSRMLNYWLGRGVDDNQCVGAMFVALELNTQLTEKLEGLKKLQSGSPVGHSPQNVRSLLSGALEVLIAARASARRIIDHGVQA